MEYKLIIDKQLIDLNKYINLQRTSIYVANKIKREETEYVSWQAKKQLKNLRIKNQVDIIFIWFEKDKRKDKDNISFAKKFILDGLVEAKILQNDGWNEIRYLSDKFYIDKENPRVEVIMTETP